MGMKTLALLLALATTASADPIRVLSWNVESGGNDPAIIARQLTEFDQADFYCLQEVGARNFGRYGAAIRDAHGDGYRFVPSVTGRGDRLLVIYDSERFELVEIRELFKHGEYRLNDWRHRSPLLLELEDRETGAAFGVMTVHLARGDKSRRREQATGLREWGRARTQPVIAVGDFNFDYDYRRNRGNRAYDNFTAEGSPWRWVRPAEDIDTNWSDRDGDGQDNYPDSCLDFAFVSGIENATARVVVRDSDFPDDDRTSDHRPVSATIEKIESEPRQSLR